MKHCDNFVVSEKKFLNSSFFKLKLKSKKTLPEINPGQFVEVQVNSDSKVLLRRPISINDVDSQTNEISLIIQTVGQGTKELAKINEGEEINLVYPLGNGFNIEGENPLLVGGGVGIAPLLYLAKNFHAKGIKPKVLLGFRSQEQMIDLKEYEKYADVYISTQDGSVGSKGLVTENEIFTQSYDTIYTCGPTPMMKAISDYSLKNNIKCYASLENKMACGIGACLCCVQNTTEGHKCTCTEGPVFNVKDIIW
ncbi:MAG: dihydroorotate dehydrogenase electron transfer subunit [Bacteroidales bacterium]|jgi:dihydroorotate dehydrogenase electron transfer subunit|nr:dihydroorotate dehydrogenase electron transfer subunit [Bacteroidales bacterium]